MSGTKAKDIRFAIKEILNAESVIFLFDHYFQLKNKMVSCLNMAFINLT